MTPFTVFYSWQSDLPNPTNRSLIEKALEAALQELSQELASEESLESAYRPEAHLQQGVEGIGGSPFIAEAILERIRKCDVFVCDVSIVSQKEATRSTPNPNVLIEYGYALSTHSFSHLLPVMNIQFGTAEMLPFDIRHRGIITYDAANGDEPNLVAKRRSERERLKGDFKETLRLAWRSKLADGEVAPSQFERAVPADGIGNFQPTHSVLGINTREPKGMPLFLASGHYAFLRVSPLTPQPHINLDIVDALSVVSGNPMLCPFNVSYQGARFGRASDGAFIYLPAQNSPTTASSISKLLLSGELWGVDFSLLNELGPIGVPATYEALFTPNRSFSFEILSEMFLTGLENFLATADQKLGIQGGLVVQCGLVGITGAHLDIATRFGATRKIGPYLQDSLTWQGEIFDLKSKPPNVLSSFFDMLYRELGDERPQ